MTRRSFLAAAAATALPAQTRPNVLLINADDQRWDTIRALGNEEIHTPNLDSLVKRGFVFRNLYCQGSMVGAVCLPSRTMLMTGRSVFRIPGRTDPPPPGLPFLAKAFEAAGYSTFHVGKRGNTYVPASDAFQTTLYAEKLTEDRALQSEKHADAILDFVRARKSGEPWFAYMAPPVPHDPRLAPKQFMDMYDPARITLPKNFMPEHPFDNGEMKVRDEMLASFPRTPDAMKKHIAEYYATISCLDHHVGRVLKAIPENTIVIFTSDQGLAVGGRHGLMGKQNLYEHVKPPLVIAGPGIRKGASGALMYMHDLFPTVCGLAKVPVPAGVEGQSLVPVMQGKQKAVRTHLFALYRDCQRMVRDSRWKLIWYPKVDRYQLFDLQSDPWEIQDLSSKQPARIAELKKHMARLQQEFDDRAAPRPS